MTYAMFPPNLQKNIRELNRQISLLESECENMEVYKGGSLSNTKAASRAGPGKPFVTGPTRSTCSHGTNRPTHSAVVPKAHSTASVPSKRSGKNRQKVRPPATEEPAFGCRSLASETEDSNLEIKGNLVRPPAEKEFDEMAKQIVHREVVITKPGETIEVTVTQKSKRDESTGRANSNRSIGSIREVTESSDETAEEVARSVVSHLGDVNESNLKNKNDFEKQQIKGRTSLDDDCVKDNDLVTMMGLSCRNANQTEDKSFGLNEHSVSVDRVPIKKTSRPRSMRTKKMWENEVFQEPAVRKSFKEKQIQCTLWREDLQKKDFLLNLSDSVRTLRILITKLKKKSDEEKRNDVIEEMQNTLMKMSQGPMRESVTGFFSHSDFLPGFQEENEGRLMREEDDIIDLKKAFYGVKKFCEQLSDEKTFLSEELQLRNRTILGLENKEKEYLSVISTLKFNLERAKEEAEEWNREKNELSAMRAKLEEETKVIEALKRSHDKMQDLVENYVLENDKLRTQMKISKLESEKYTILLAGKEEEIKKYKQEIGSFQRQICEQLNLLRSKASENQVDKAIKAITNQTSLLSQTEMESFRSETNELSERFSKGSSKTSLDSSWSQSRDSGKEDATTSFPITKETIGSGNDVGYTSCRSDEFETCAKPVADEIFNSKRGKNPERTRSNRDENKMKKITREQFRFNGIDRNRRLPIDVE